MKRYNYEFSTLTELLETAATLWPERPFSQFVDGSQPYTYSSFRTKVQEISDLLSKYDIAPGDKVSLLAENMPNWTVAFLATNTSGRVSVPMLPGCSKAEADNIITHSESRALFISKGQLAKVSDSVKENLALIVTIEDFSVISGTVADTPVKIDRKPEYNDMAAIIYTSGTSGNAKGVMLSHQNLCQNVKAAYFAQPAKCKDRFLSILPMGHAYEMSFGMLYPIYLGASVHYIKGLPTPAILLPAMAKVRPSLMLSVPLVMEKIYKGIMKVVDGSKPLQWLQNNIPFLFYFLIGKTLKKKVGGKMMFFGIGGAKLNPTVETFLKNTHFPYAIGYGLTETAPLITFAAVKNTRVGSCGVNALNVEVKLDNVNPENGEGEIIARGPNVMMGYYKDPERTKQVITEDGWFHTGDLACIDKKGRYYIKGRLNCMIVGASGENIYPEEIEQVINSFPGVNESLVVEREQKLVALVTLEDGLRDTMDDVRKSIQLYVNKRVNNQSAITKVEIMMEPFKKTATQKIRRILYKE